jgi:hypothetical protein
MPRCQKKNMGVGGHIAFATAERKGSPLGAKGDTQPSFFPLLVGPL